MSQAKFATCFHHSNVLKYISFIIVEKNIPFVHSQRIAVDLDNISISY